jgi:hypothetical protein
MSNSRILSKVPSDLANTANGTLLSVENGEIVWQQNYAWDAANTSNLNAANASFLTTGTVPNARLSNIPNSSLANSSITINGTGISLGGSGTVTANAATLTGTNLNSTVTGSSLTSVGTLSSLSVSGTTSLANVSYTGTLTGGTGIVNIGSGQIYKDSSGNVGVGITSGRAKLEVYDSAFRTSPSDLIYLSANRGFSNTADGIKVSFISQGTLGTHDYGSFLFQNDTSQVNGGACLFEARIGGSSSTGNFGSGDNAFLTARYRNGNGIGVDYITFRTNGSERARFDSSGKFLIGSTSVIGTSGDNLQILQPSVAGITIATSTTPTNGTSFTGIGAYAYDGSSYFVGGTINFRADENWSTTNHGSLIQFRLIPSGSGGTLREVARIDSAGNLGIGTNSPGSGLQISKAYSVDTDGATNKWTARFNDTSAYGVGKGGSLLFQGDKGTGLGNFAGIAGLKENNTSGNEQGYLALYTTPSTGIITERLRVDSSGNLGLGVTPSGWSSGYKSIDIGTRSASFTGSIDATYVSTNAYNDGAWKYKGTSGFGSSLYAQFNGSHFWSAAPSGTAGSALSFGNPKMTLTAAGDLGIGTSPSSRLHVLTGTAIASLFETNASSSDNVQIRFAGTSGNRWAIGNNIAAGGLGLNFDIFDLVNNVNRFRIDSSGSLGIGTSSPGSTALRLAVEAGGDNNLPVVSIRRTNNVAGGVGNPEVGLDVQIPNTFNSAGDVKGINIFARHNLSGNTYGIYAEAGGNPSSSNRYAGYFTITHPDTNGSAVNYAIYARANAIIGGSSSGFSIGVTAETSNYVNNQNFRAVSLYTGGATQIVFDIIRNGSRVGSITTSTSATAYNTSSDYRLKEQVQPIKNALSRVSLLKPSTYKWNVDGSECEGFIAHELQEVVPHAVSGEKDGKDMQGVDYGKLTPLLAAAIQELRAEIESLKQRIN